MLRGRPMPRGADHRVPLRGTPPAGRASGAAASPASAPAIVLLASLLPSCGGGTPPEATLVLCTNGRDDDGDTMIDCADADCRIYAVCAVRDAGSDSGPVDVGPRPDGARCSRAVDVVLVLDVSSSMEAELAVVRDQSSAIFDALRALDDRSQISLVVFVDDALAVGECAPLVDGPALATQLEDWRLLAPMNRSSVQPGASAMNQDCAENSLDALHLAATTCPWRPSTARVIVHVTDDTFAEAPTVLSGPFGGGIVVQHTFASASAALVTAGARAVTVTLDADVGEDCGAGRSADVRTGFFTPFAGMPPLHERTMGRALDLAALRAGTLDLGTAIVELAETACQ
jgi:hypothetical protein